MNEFGRTCVVTNPDTGCSRLQMCAALLKPDEAKDVKNQPI